MYDNKSTGYEVYPRYPIETLVDGVGDCEDYSILTAALLTEMGYDVVVILPPEHAAIGLKSSGTLTGKSYRYGENQYYYVETTYAGWRIGELPSEFRNVIPEIQPVNPNPIITVELKPSYKWHDSGRVVYDIEYTITNRSPTDATNVSFYMYMKAEPFEDGWSWGNYELDIETLHGGQTISSNTTLEAGRGKTCLFFRLYGDNVIPIEMSSHTIYV